MPFSYKGIGGRTLGSTKHLRHLHWKELHRQISSFFAPLMAQCITLPLSSFLVEDSSRTLAFLFLPKLLPPEAAFLSFPPNLQAYHEGHFQDEGPFNACRRFDSHSAGASHHGISGVFKGQLKHYKETHIPTLEFLAPLAKAIQRLIKNSFPDIWEGILSDLPTDFPTIGGSIFQSIAVNYRCSSVLHRDVSDSLLAWIYYFDDFDDGQLCLPELGINIPVRPQSLFGLHGKYMFHSVLQHKGTRSSISFYVHYSTISQPAFDSVSPVVSFLMSDIDWSI